MMTNTKLEKTIRKTTKLSSFIGSIVTIVSVLFIVYGFYFRATAADENQSKAIEEVKKDVVEIRATINNTEVFKGVSTAEYNALKEKVGGIEKTVEKIDSKLDRILIQTK